MKMVRPFGALLSQGHSRLCLLESSSEGTLPRQPDPGQWLSVIWTGLVQRLREDCRYMWVAADSRCLLFPMQ
jgi:hypothetical protein